MLEGNFVSQGNGELVGQEARSKNQEPRKKTLDARRQISDFRHYYQPATAN